MSTVKYLLLSQTYRCLILLKTPNYIHLPLKSKGDLNICNERLYVDVIGASRKKSMWTWNKVELLKNKLGFDEAFNYKEESDLEAPLPGNSSFYFTICESVVCYMLIFCLWLTLTGEDSGTSSRLCFLYAINPINIWCYMCKRGGYMI